MVLAASALLAACGGTSSTGASTTSTTGSRQASLYTGATPGGSPVHGGTLVFERGGEPTSFDPLVGDGDTFSEWEMMQVFDGLVRYLPGTLSVQPDIATSWSVSPDGLTYRFDIRHGVRFSNGSPLTTNDVVFSLRRLASPKADAIAPFIYSNMAAESSPAPYVVVVKLKKPLPAFLQYLAAGFGGIVPQKYFTSVGQARFAQHPIGSGPFAVSQWLHGQSLTMVRNADYWDKPKPYLDKIVFRDVPDANTRVADLKTNAAQIIESPPFSQINSLKATPGIKVVINPFNAVNTITLNNSVKPLNQLAFRQALASSTPRAQMAKTVYGGYVALANGIIPKLEYWSPNVQDYPYDLATARKYLAAAHVPPHTKLNVLVVGSDFESTQVATILQNTWQSLGLKVNISQVDQATFLNKITHGAFTIAVEPIDYATNDTNTPDEQALYQQDGAAGSEANFSYYNSPATTRLVLKAVTSTSEAERAKLFPALQAIGVRQVQLIPLFFPPAINAASTRVHDFSAIPPGWWRLEQVYLTK